MIKREELSNPNSCMSRAKDGEMTFVLLSRDAAAPVAIRAWVAERVRLGKNAIDDEQIKEALHCCGYMDQQRRDRIGMEESASASPEVPRPGCTLCGQEMVHCYRCTKCGSISGCTAPDKEAGATAYVAGFRSPPSEADLARIALRHFPVKLESQLGIVKKDVSAKGRAACLAALREACGMGGKA